MTFVTVPKLSEKYYTIADETNQIIKLANIIKNTEFMNRAKKANQLYIFDTSMIKRISYLHLK